MERTKRTAKEKIRWQKLGGGVFIMGDGSHIKPNQTFLAFPHEVPEAFRDLIKPVNKADLEEPPVVLESVTKFAVKERAPGWFDVIEENTGKVLNQSALRKDEAEKLAQELE